MFRLQRRAVAFTRIRDRGGEVPDVRSEHRPPSPFYPSGGPPRHRRHNVFKPLTHLGPEAQALRSHPRGSQQGQISVRIQRLILCLAGYKTPVGTGPSSRR